MRRRLWALMVLSVSAAMLVTAIFEVGWGLFDLDFMLVLAALGYSVAGSIVLARTNATGVGGAMSIIGLSLLASGLIAWYTVEPTPGVRADVSGPLLPHVSPILVGAGSASWYSAFAGFGMPMAWFPTGTVPGRRWRWLNPLGFMVAALTLVFSLLSERVCLQATEAGCLSWAQNPIGITGIPTSERSARRSSPSLRSSA